MRQVILGATTAAHAVLQRSGPTAFGTGAKLIKSSAGRLYRVTFVNTTATRCYVQVHDSSSAPGAGAAPIWVDALPPSTTLSGAVTLPFDDLGLYCANGIYLTASSTSTTLTYLAGDTTVACALYA